MLTFAGRRVASGWGSREARVSPRLACPDCGGRLRLLATIKQREVIERILAHLGLPTDPIVPAPARHEEELFA